ncbi:coenzyme F420-0:L-glutamate ligase / coenzyme F420-1:gamma-L-glutamate ligase [Thermoflexales bacterium]|nr:coenzyme F420-0:L-glutamate ligase / coenzyme F420-1:gamma-L-glutamate ligase [Thermoflexales bacterium]
MNSIEIIPLTGIPLIQPGDDLPQLLSAALARAGGLRDRDVLVVAQKIISKAEGRYVDLDRVTPSPQALEIAQQCEKDPRLIEVILAESREVVRVRPGLIITRHRLGFVSANAGVDRSNVAPEGIDRVLLLPLDPDRSAAQLRSALCDHFGIDLAVIIADSHGRPHRMGTVGVAIGLAGLPGVEDWRGRKDLFGYTLQHTEVGVADQIAAAATLLLGQAAESTPAAIVRGVSFESRAGSAREINRPQEMDLFR